ncbi:MAG: hypothetical protein IRY94_05045, partial [Rhodospirillaceae bacterium]|nr:hypothetical protein [Rhodospirillaceae bacterium]
LLRRLGVGEEEIETRLWRRALGGARLMRRIGDNAAARRLLALAFAHRPAVADLGRSLRFGLGVVKCYL